MPRMDPMEVELIQIDQNVLPTSQILVCGLGSMSWLCHDTESKKLTVFEKDVFYCGKDNCLFFSGIFFREE